MGRDHSLTGTLVSPGGTRVRLFHDVSGEGTLFNVT